MRVALFTSCAADVAAQGPALAAARVLEATGAVVDVPGGQTCCGQMALNSGHPGPATRLMRRWLRVFEDYDAVVGVSGSCTATVYHQFPRVLEGRWYRRAEAAVGRTWELTQFLAEHGASLELALSGDITWHDSCHMLRSLGRRHRHGTSSPGSGDCGCTRRSTTRCAAGSAARSHSGTRSCPAPWQTARSRM
ncbi:heterodisulfide reductase-related iron-sulfur binding cluster [Parasphingorhabdus pacifica]